MLKIILLLIVTLTITFAAVWFVENDGFVNVHWLGYDIELSVAALILIIISTTAILFLLTSFIFWLITIPSRYRKNHEYKVKEKGYEALAKGFVAIAEGNTERAKSYAKEAQRKLKDVTALQLLQAQTYQLDGNDDEAKSQYNLLLENKDTEIIGIKGLILQAEKNENIPEAIYLAERAKKRDVKSQWANKVLLRLYKISKKWHEAQIILGDLVKFKIVHKDEIKRENAIINLSISREYQGNGNNKEALKYANKAYSTLDSFVPTILQYCTILNKLDKKAKARKILEKSWITIDNPQLAQLYTQINIDLTPEKQLKFAQKLLKVNPESAESHYIVAKQAILANNFVIARNHLKIAISKQESRKIYRLMIDLEKLDGNDEVKINNWKIKALSSEPEPSWQCSECMTIYENWQSVCDNCNSFDTVNFNQTGSRQYVANVIDDLLIEDGRNLEQN